MAASPSLGSLVKTENICIFFLPFSGGKFIANCLALSRHVLCNSPGPTEQDLDSVEFDASYYDFKLRAVLTSLPKNFQVTGEWTEFIGPQLKFKKLAQEKNRKFCHLVHFNHQLEELKQTYPDLKVCQILNFEKFNSLAFMLKSKTKDIKRHQLGFTNWVNESSSGDITIDMDKIIYDQQGFLSEIKHLYDYFGLDDYQPELLIRFYQAYLECHSLP